MSEGESKENEVKEDKVLEDQELQDVGYFEKNVFVHERDGQGQLIPVDVEVELKDKGIKGKIQVLPMTKGEIDSMRALSIANQDLMKKEPEKAAKVQESLDRGMILKYVVKPKLDESDFEFLKPREMLELVKGIMIASGFEKEELDNMFKRLVDASIKEAGGDSPLG
jgi:hypothetical protein